MDEDQAGATPAAERPLWQWIARAIAPALACDLIIVLATAEVLPDQLAIALLYCNLFAPIFILGYIIWLSGRYAASISPLRTGARLRFALGMLALNALLWGTGCALFLSQLSVH